MNTLQVDPLTGILTDATGKAIDDIQSKQINFSGGETLGSIPGMPYGHLSLFLEASHDRISPSGPW
jgi:hypothetical protein